MAFDFPNAPTVGQSYTSGGVTYKWNGLTWDGGPIADTGIFQPKDVNLTALAALADSAAGYPLYDGVGGATTVAAATSAEFRGGSAARLLENDDVWAAAAEVVTPYASTVALDMRAFINTIITLTGTMLLDNPTNFILGRSGVIHLAAAAAQTITFGNNWYFPASGKPASVAIGDSMLYYYCSAANKMFCSFVGPYSNA